MVDLKYKSYVRKICQLSTVSNHPPSVLMTSKIQTLKWEQAFFARSLGILANSTLMEATKLVLVVWAT